MACCPSSARQRIGINAHLLTEEEGYRRAGVGRYIYNLVLHVLREDPEGDYAVFVNSRCALSLSGRHRSSWLPTYIPTVRILWEQFLQPFALLHEQVALLHSPVNVQPALLPCKGVVTVTDLSFLAFPKSFRAGQRFYQRLFTRMSVRRADHVITYSESTAKDVAAVFNVPADRISVVYPGVDSAYQPVSNCTMLGDFRRRRGLPGRFILFVGTLEPRKNLVMLLNAYAKFKRQMPDGPKLVLVGGRGWLHRPIDSAIEKLGLADDVICPGYIPEQELPLWYNAAEVFVYPSLYEGFGLPPLEALACGTPVVVSDASSLPEVVGTAGLLVDPHQPSAWAAALSRLCRDSELRRDLASQGREHSAQFSWTSMARETIQVYHRVLRSPQQAVRLGDK